MSTPWIASMHVWAAAVSLVLGAAMLLMRKGTRRHKQVGYAYVGHMLALNLAALALYRLNGQFNLFHVCALVSLFSLLGGMLPAILRRPAGWLRLHYEFMAWSYIGLVAAAVSESAVRLPSTPFWPAVAAGSLLVIASGALGVHFLRPRFAQMFGAAERRSQRAPGTAEQPAQSPR